MLLPKLPRSLKSTTLSLLSAPARLSPGEPQFAQVTIKIATGNTHDHASQRANDLVECHSDPNATTYRSVLLSGHANPCSNIFRNGQRLRDPLRICVRMVFAM